jgi:hypothetical protein
MSTFEKIDNVWQSTKVFVSKPYDYYLRASIRHHKEKYPGASIGRKFAFVAASTSRLHPDISYDKITISFDNEADECEFILRESI